MMNLPSIRRALARALPLTLAAVLLAGCATTRLASTWRDPEFKRVPIKKLAVFVVSKDETVRRFAEDQAVRSMPPGTLAVAGHTLFEQPDGDIEKIKARLARDGFDAALVSRLVSVDRDQTYVPPQVHFVPMGPVVVPRPYYRSFYGFYPYAWTYTYTTPGYTAETTRIVIETLVYQLPEGRPVWSGVSESVNPSSPLDLVNQLVKIVRAELFQEGLLESTARQ